MSKVGYRDIENIPDDEGTFTAEEKSPCIGRDALSGVYYHPAPALGTQLSLSGSLYLKYRKSYHCNFFVLNTDKLTISHLFSFIHLWIICARPHPLNARQFT